MPRKWRTAAFEDDDDVYGDYDDDYEYEEEYGDDQEATSTSESLRTHAVEQQQQQQQVVAGHTDDARGVVDVWRCSVCTYDNAVDLQSCDICGVARHNPADFLPTSKKASGTKNTLQFLVVMNLNLLAW
jgi:rubrerythrin